MIPKNISSNKKKKPHGKGLQYCQPTFTFCKAYFNCCRPGVTFSCCSLVYYFILPTVCPYNKLSQGGESGVFCQY